MTRHDNSVVQRLSAIRNQLARDMTPRVSYGLVLLFGLICFWLYSSLNTYRHELQDRLQSTRTEIEIVSQSDGGEIWEARLAEARQTEKLWRDKMWIDGTPGIISAAAQKAISVLGSEAELRSLQVSVSSDPIDMEGQSLLRFEVVGIGTSETFINMLVSLATHHRTVFITDIHMPIRGDTATRMNLGGYIPILVTSSTAGEQQ